MKNSPTETRVYVAEDCGWRSWYVAKTSIAARMMHLDKAGWGENLVVSEVDSAETVCGRTAAEWARESPPGFLGSFRK